MSAAITNGGEDRGYKLCRCSECGEESICTPENDFYTIDSCDAGPLICTPCFLRHVREVMSISVED